MGKLFERPNCRGCISVEEVEVKDKRGEVLKTYYKCKVHKRALQFAGVKMPDWCDDNFKSQPSCMNCINIVKGQTKTNYMCSVHNYFIPRISMGISDGFKEFVIPNWCNNNYERKEIKE